MRRVLLTGARGFIGREVIPALRRAGCEVHAITSHGGDIPGAAVHRLDLLTDDPVPMLERVKADCLLHLAWYAEPGKFWNAPENLDWVAASIRLVRAFSSTGGDRVVIAGSCAEYDWSRPELDEGTTPLCPATLYGEAKASLFRLLARAEPNIGISLGWGRIFFPFGPEDRPERLLGSLMRGFSKRQPIDLSAGAQVRNFIHVADVAEALTRLLLSTVSGAVNIALRETISVREFAEAAARAVDAEQLLRFGRREMQPGDPLRLEAATRRLYDEVGFTPSFGIRDGVIDAVLRMHRHGEQRQ